jgi:SnoaL-like domain
MFTRRQAIRWAELWLSCWNEGDFETLLALYRDTARFGNGRSNGASARSHDSTIEAFKRHWAAVPFGIHSVRGDLERVSWDPETRELTIVYATDIGGMQLHGCDLVTLDADGRVVLGEPCVGRVADESEVAEGLLVPVARHSVEGGR